MATAEHEVIEQEAAEHEEPDAAETAETDAPAAQPDQVQEARELLDELTTLIEKSGGQTKRAREIMFSCEAIALALLEEPAFAEPLDEWPVDDDEKPEAYAEATQPRLIAEQLIRKLVEFQHLRGKTLVYLYRPDPFTVGGKPAIGKCQKPGGLLRRFSGADFILVFAHTSWQKLNVWQRVALVYHELRHAGWDEMQEKPYIKPHQWEGFFDELQIFGLETFRDWQDLASATQRARTARPQLLQLDLLSGVDQLNDEEGREIAAETRETLRREQRRALAASLEDTEVPEGAAEMDDEAILTWLLDVWDEDVLVYEDEDRDYPQLLKHTPDGVRLVWCAVRTDHGVPRFWYDIDPETFEPTALAETFSGAALCREVRRAWGVLEEPEPEVRVETEGEAEESEISAWMNRTRPEAQMDSNTSILLAGVHELLTARMNLCERLFAVHQEGIVDDDLEELLANSLEDGIGTSVSVEVPIVGGESEFVAVEAKVDPLMFAMKRGRKKEALKGDGVITAIRTMLEIPEPAESAEPAAVGAGDDELPF